MYRQHLHLMVIWNHSKPLWWYVALCTLNLDSAAAYQYMCVCVSTGQPTRSVPLPCGDVRTCTVNGGGWEVGGASGQTS